MSEPAPDHEKDEVDLSPQELDEMFGDEEPEALPSMSASDSDGDDGQLIDPDEIPDPDPIPQALTSDEDDDDNREKPSKMGKVIGISFATFISIFLVSGYFLKSQILNIVPAAAVIYDMIGIGDEEIGAGLKILNVKSSRETEEGQEILIIRGRIKNISEIIRTVPIVQVDLFDGKGNSIQNTHVTPIRNKLEPRKQVSFKARLIKPSPMARKLEVTFKKFKGNDTELDKANVNSDKKTKIDQQ
jgi:hypothetical protein